MDNRKLILFDWGNVMMNAEFGDFTIYDVNRIVADEVGIPIDVLNKVVRSDALWILSGRELDEFLALYMPKHKVQVFKTTWKKYMDDIPWFEKVLDTMALISMEAGTYTDIGILSVCSEMDAPLIKRKAGRYVKYFFFSYSIGLIKPDRRIYPLIETVLDISGEDILYFDDLSSSVAAAGRRGWKAVCTDGRNDAFIRKRCSEFLGQELKDTMRLKISTWMTEIHPHKQKAPVLEQVN